MASRPLHAPPLEQGHWLRSAASTARALAFRLAYLNVAGTFPRLTALYGNACRLDVPDTVCSIRSRSSREKNRRRYRAWEMRDAYGSERCNWITYLRRSAPQ